ncbi:Cochaperone prefoldin complex subunit [Ophidiomyces ophidiicola]|uniref:Cochaperone prefoldin complex subunit n=1 Tax=Ophidiomyces ophidiicola TaxID=1387563 RepID=A0ACB8UMQ1_9EURO|nr:Cochaperone prefoldin complex subunit [Ophidiomyces ophidiicola]KAI1916965.1 Cochaperone prefoldin complex subunit [Ophidiomyces ophidiicola]KAI1927123.1 Cochaperone prefoldin complex subunit [Ophidiomyces ophidiicola]KAI1947385.1 Cochaperone prefoldin complex subunit [Ophidiomyces ophidiicola]KAI1964343.1 Cochaperone prefoldin complex subunit [Ophidiomyces ophidiicola]
MATPQVNSKKQQELQAQYSTYKNTLQQLAQKIGDIEQETEEHKLVVETLEPLSGDRKCFRMINGVLVERTVKDVIPALKTNSDGLKQVLDELLKQYKSKQDEMDNWKGGTPLLSEVFYLWAVLINLFGGSTEKEQHTSRSTMRQRTEAEELPCPTGEVLLERENDPKRENVRSHMPGPGYRFRSLSPFASFFILLR